jgi:hypothetical protein
MKKTSFIVSLLALVALLAVSNTASAQIYANQSLAVPATLATGVTTNLASPQTLGALKQQNVAVSVTISATAATTNLYTFNRSVDGVNWDTNAANNVVLGAYVAGATPVTTTTNWSAAGFGYYRLATIQVVGAGTVTNNAVSYGVKIAAP